MNELQVIEMQGQRVLTTRQISEMYGVTEKMVSNNFSNNKCKYVEGKHYIWLAGKELTEFLNSQNIGVQNKSRIRHLYLWTEKGALLHAKSLNTDKAWEVYDYLVDFYFRVKEEQAAAVVEKKAEVAPVQPAKELEKKPEPQLPYMKNPIKMFSILLQLAAVVGIKVNSYEFRSFGSMLRNNQIGIRTNCTVERACYELAWELSHALIHYDAGKIINSPLSKEYNKQADRAADMIIKLLNVCQG